MSDMSSIATDKYDKSHDSLVKKGKPKTSYRSVQATPKFLTLKLPVQEEKLRTPKNDSHTFSRSLEIVPGDSTQENIDHHISEGQVQFIQDIGCNSKEQIEYLSNEPFSHHQYFEQRKSADDEERMSASEELFNRGTTSFNSTLSSSEIITPDRLVESAAEYPLNSTNIPLSPVPTLNESHLVTEKMHNFQNEVMEENFIKRDVANQQNLSMGRFINQAPGSGSNETENKVLAENYLHMSPHRGPVSRQSFQQEICSCKSDQLSQQRNSVNNVLLLPTANCQTKISLTRRSPTPRHTVTSNSISKQNDPLPRAVADNTEMKLRKEMNEHLVGLINLISKLNSVGTYIQYFLGESMVTKLSELC